MLANTGVMVINPALYTKLPYSTLRDFVPVARTAMQPLALMVNPKVPVHSLQEFVAYAKARPGQINYGSAGNGGSSHLVPEMFKSATGLFMVHIPYRGTAPALNDLVSGQVDVFFDNIASSAQFHTAKRIKVLAVADSRRSRALPDISTFSEMRLPAMQAVTFFSVVAPPGTPSSVARRIQGHLAAAMALPDVREKFAAQGAEPGGQTPEETSAFIQAESAKWKNVISTANVTLD
jgi:tripartite-type tricarboxylate transporter receptor subunit TctC